MDSFVLEFYNTVGDLPFLGFEQTGDGFQGSRLAGSVGPQE